MLTKLVIDSKKIQTQILYNIYNRSGYKGQESTYYRVLQRYFWHGCYKDIRDYIKTCKECQFRTAGRQEEAMYLIASNGLMEKWAINITYILLRRGKKYLIVARDDISGQVKARAVINKEAKIVATFIQEDVICRHGIFQRIVVDKGGKFKDKVILLLNK